MLTVIAAVLLSLAGGCGDDEGDLVNIYGPLVGGPCTDILDCVSGSFCARGGDFPEGTCTVPCRDHYDCPGASACVDKEDGACLLACARDSDCRGGYRCKDIDDERGGGKSRVCIK